MALKKTVSKLLNVSCADAMQALRTEEFAKLNDTTFLEEAKTASGIEFRYVRQTTAMRYGMNFFIRVYPVTESSSNVELTLQSRKVTVLFYPASFVNPLADRVFTSIEILSKDGKSTKKTL